MKTTNVAIVNGISLQVVADAKEQLVVIKPVCDILGVALHSQLTKLKEHPIFGSTITLSITVGADGKSREMACIPLRFFSSWLFSINPDIVKEDIRDNLIQFQLKCNDILFNYFFNRADFALKKEQAIVKAKEEYDESTEEVRLAKSRQKIKETAYNKALSLTFEDYLNDQQQLKIPGFE